MREKQIKAGSGARKLALIEELNPDWKDIYDKNSYELVLARSGKRRSNPEFSCFGTGLLR